MVLEDALYQFFSVSGDWRVLAGCREAPIEMVPGGETGDVNTGPEVQQARLVCAACPVWRDCLAAGEGETGIWGGLTRDERGRLTVNRHLVSQERREIVKCETCGFRCVPMLLDDRRCDDCFPAEFRPTTADGFRLRISLLVKARLSYEEVSWATGLPVSVVTAACRQWGTTSRAAGNKSGSKRDAAMLAPCGTPAAVRRHQRRGEEIVGCACAQPGSSNPNRTIKNGWVA